MINELNILIWFGLASIIIVSVMRLFQHMQSYSAGYDAHVSASNLNHNHIDTDQTNISISHRGQPDLFCDIFESAPECFKLQKRDGTIELINRTGLTLFEAEQSSRIIDHSIYKLIVDEYHQSYREMTESVFRGNKASLEYEMLTMQGNRRWVRTKAMPLYNKQRQVINLIAISYDITETRQIEQQLEAHRKKLQTIIESEPECVKLQDAEGKILEMNPAGLSLLKAQKYDDVIGKTIYDFMTEEYIAEYRNLTEQVFNGGRGSMEFEVVSLKGRRQWLETHAAPLFDNSGNVSALLAITRDIDTRKKDEVRLHQQQTELARVCRLSTMGEMASSLAHELNQPLCAVSSYAESAQLLNTPVSKGLNELLDKIVLQSQRATQIIQNMRDFVRKQTPVPESISAASIINNVINFIEPERRRNMINIDLKIDAELPPVKADRVQIEQVLLNLISNAIQAVGELPQEQRKITIKVTREPDEELVFQVCNLGPDIVADVVKELFTPFYTTKATGMGMGLSISRSIVEAHGGRIWYKAKQGFGACFNFTLPTTDDD